MDSIVKAAIEARTVRDVDKLEGMVRQAIGDKIRYLGDREANWSAISGSTDPTGVIYERVTNMWDANIEFQAERRKCDTLRSPVEAAAQFFGVTDGMAGLGSGRRAGLAELATMSLLDSDNAGPRPTIGFRDKGMGLHTTQVGTTILSLEGSNKLYKPWTHGVFGKGGSTACAFSDATIIITRRQPELLDGLDDRVTVIVVREADLPTMRLPFFRYVVGANDLPYSVSASDAPGFEPGTFVLHINYQAGRMGTENWNQEESVYAYAETILFDPTMPYGLLDARSGAANRRPEGRGVSVLAGLSQRLGQLTEDDDALLAQSNWQSIPVPGAGEVRLRWWLFVDTDRRRRRAAKGYVVSFTTNGQVHHAWDQAKLQNMVESRRRVGTRLLVHVDCDGIELKRRYKVFDSFRVQVRRGPEGRALEEAVAYAISTDPDLDAFESEFVRQSLKATAQNISKSFRDRLNRALRAKIPGLAPSDTPGKGPKPPKPKPETELYPEPTTITGPENVTLLIGSRATAFMEINAVDGFVPDRGAIYVSATDGSDVPGIGVADLRKGRLPLTLVAPAGMTEGTREVEVTVEWLRSSGGLGRIAWPMKINVVATIAPRPPRPEPQNDGGQTKAKSGEIAFIWVNGQADMAWTDAVVGELQEIKGSDLAVRSESYGDLKDVDDEIPTLVLNREFSDFSAYKRTVARRLSDASLGIRDERYGLGVGIAVANLTLREREIRRKHTIWESKQNGNEEPPRPLEEAQMQRAFAEAARGVVALMPDFDSLLNDWADGAS